MSLYKSIRVISCLLIVTVIAAGFGTTAVSGITKSYIRGDVDGNGFVTVADATWVQKKIAEMQTPDFNFAAGDVDGNGLYVSDATSIQRYAAEFAENPYHIGEIVYEESEPEPSRDEYELPFVPN